MWRNDQDEDFKAREAERKCDERAKAKVKRAEKDAETRDRITRLSMERNDLKKANTNLKNQMYSDVAIKLKDQGIVSKGNNKYIKEF